MLCWRNYIINILKTKVVKITITRLLCSETSFWRSCNLWDHGGKCGRTRLTTGDNIIRRLRNSFWVAKATHALVISDTYCFAKATRVMRTRLSFTLYLNCLSVCFSFLVFLFLFWFIFFLCSVVFFLSVFMHLFFSRCRSAISLRFSLF